MKKRFFAIALSALLVLSLGACGGNATSSTASSEAEASSAVSSEVESSEAESSEVESSEVESSDVDSSEVESESETETEGVELSETDGKCIELLNAALTEMGETETAELVSSTPADDKGVTTLRVTVGSRKLQATFYENEGELALFTVSKDKVRNHLFYCADTTLMDDLLGLKSGTLYTYTDDAYAALLDCETAIDYAFTNEAAGQE